ncbi:MAG TPA: hypothetical protein VGJ00_10500 [Rhabdochlamydiaceae bacterium]|jgi:hypothetical protein
MNDYVFVDANNGHYEEYFNFKSTASEKEILNLIKKMESEDCVYARLGMGIQHLANELIEKGFKFELLDNNIKRLYIDRIIIRGTSGNY